MDVLQASSSSLDWGALSLALSLSLSLSLTLSLSLSLCLSLSGQEQPRRNGSMRLADCFHSLHDRPPP